MTIEQIKTALREVIDPELGINIVDLGLVYEVELRERGAHVLMTVTSPACPLGSYLADSARAIIHERLPELQSVDVEIVLDPAWSPDLISPEAREQLGW